MGGNYTALARGYEAVAWNPANLASPGRPFISFGTMAFGGTFGLDPVDVTAMYKLRGVLVDSATRVSWVDLVRESGRQRIRGDGGVTLLGMSVGPIGLQVGSAMATSVSLSPDAFEAVMFGNAGNNGGQPKALSMKGTEVSSSLFTTGALSFALPVPIRFGFILPNQHASLGITAKYVTANAMGLARDSNTVFSANGTGSLNFPIIMPDTALVTQLRDDHKPPIIGSGMGADLGLTWAGGPWRVGVVAENIFNSFKWDTTKLRFAPGTGQVDPTDTTYTDTDPRPFGQAPQGLRDEIMAQAFKPAVTIGVAFSPVSFLTLTGDYHRQLGGVEAISLGPTQRAGVGMELRILPFVPLRAGVASVTDGWQAAAGFGFRFAGYELGVGTSVRRRGAASESGLMISAIGIGH